MNAPDPRISEQAAFEMAFFEGLIREKPHFTDALIPLADAYTKSGLWEKGLELDLRLSTLLPNDESVCYNLACSYALLQRRDEAFKALGRAVELGYRDLRHLEQDRDLNDLRGDPRYPRLIARLKDSKERKTSG